MTISEEISRLMPQVPDATTFTVVCRRSDYSAGNIAHAIEDCNAHVLNLNVTSDSVGDDMVAVEVRVYRRNVASIARSLARYDYTVVDQHMDGEPQIDDRDRRRVAELLRYIDI